MIIKTDEDVHLTPKSVKISTTQIYDAYSMFDKVAVDFLDYLYYGSGDEEITGRDSMIEIKQ